MANERNLLRNHEKDRSQKPTHRSLSSNERYFTASGGLGFVSLADHFTHSNTPTLQNLAWCTVQQKPMSRCWFHWGRRRSRRSNSMQKMVKDMWDQLQWGRRRSRRSNTDFTAGILDRQQASMGPPTISAEQLLPGLSRAQGLHRFNGAADDLGGATGRVRVCHRWLSPASMGPPTISAEQRLRRLTR